LILINKPFLPPEKEYKDLVSSIWENQWLTNDGPFVRELEQKLGNYLNVNKLLFVNNGTMALQLAIKSLDLKGEIITTPFSFVATTSAIVWENCTPVFVDIDKDTLNIDAKKIEASITDKTSAILATHVFGNACDVEAIEKIARKYSLKVIYDGAHAFGVNVSGKSIFEYGDISICSTHATKVYHTIEGGFLVTKNELLSEKIDAMRNFGFKDTTSFSCLGINGKNSEFHAAMGIVNLKYQEEITKKRKLLTDLYDKLLNNKAFSMPCFEENSNKNYSYYPLVFENEDILLECIKDLENQNIFPRRYFYPALSNSLNYVENNYELPIVNDISKRILCLPLYFDLETKEVIKIANILNQSIINTSKKQLECR
jgi:dTDP-4-amino-4,6-dideoxygalactose transaminase